MNTLKTDLHGESSHASHVLWRESPGDYRKLESPDLTLVQHMNANNKHLYPSNKQNDYAIQ